MDSEQAKVFIGGISWETTEETLKEYFKAYGEVVETVIMRDRLTGRARGFGFVGFAEPAVVDRLLQEKHTINGRTVELKRAVPRDEQQRNAQKSNTNFGAGAPRTKKIFVGGLAPTVTEDDFRKYFEQFGNITDVVVMYDHTTQRPRGFGFITFDSEEAVEKVVLKSFHELHGKMVEVKRALPKEMSPGSVRSRSSPMGAFGVRPDSRYGAPPAGRGGYPPYGAVSGYFAGGYGSGANGGGYGAAPPAPGYGGAPAGYAGYAGGAYGGVYGNPPYGAGAGPYVSAPVGGAYSAGGVGSPWGSGVRTGPTTGLNTGYGYGGVDTGYTGGYGASGTGSYVAPAGGGNSYPGNASDMYGTSGYVDSHNLPPSGGSVGSTPGSGYVNGPVPADSRVNGTSGYGAAGRQTPRIADARFRPYPASGDRAS